MDTGTFSSNHCRVEAKNTFCRNVTIYGHCRYENSELIFYGRRHLNANFSVNAACPYVHDPARLNNPQMQNENIKKRFNVDSPSFTPLQPATNGALTPAPRSAAISPKAANAAVFTPKSQRSSRAPFSYVTVNFLCACKHTQVWIAFVS